MDTLVQRPRLESRFMCFNLEIRKSKIHRFGVYAMENIPAKRKVIEYTGERINRTETKRRGEGEYTYLFTLDKYWTLDGAFGGSGAEIVNHSCEPNLITRIIKGHIIYMTLRPIKKGEELLVDYSFEYLGDRSPCACGAGKCRGFMEKISPKFQRELDKEKAARELKQSRAANKNNAARR